MYELYHAFTDRKISPCEGIMYLHKPNVSSGILECLAGLYLPYLGSNRGYAAPNLIKGVMTSVVLGARRLKHSGMLRIHQIIRSIFGWKRGTVSTITFSRFFNKFDVVRNDGIFPHLMKFILSLSPIQHMTIDIDSTVIARYGTQEEASKGYNPGKPPHHPLLAFINGHKMVVNAWMRSGDSHSNTDTIGFLDEFFSIVKPKGTGLLRGPSGFYSDQIMSHLEGQHAPVCYILRIKMTGALMSEIVSHLRFWHNNSVVQGTAYIEFVYQVTNWKQGWWTVVLRMPKNGNRHATKELFKEYKELFRYDYIEYATTSDLSMVDAHRRYKQRGDSENRIRQLKQDYGVGGFALQQFGIMETAFRFLWSLIIS